MTNHEQPKSLEAHKNIQKSILAPKNTIYSKSADLELGPVTPPPILLSQSQNDLQTICINNFEKKIPICLLSFASISFEVGPILDFEFSRPLL